MQVFQRLPVLRRVRALEESGYIEGYHAQLHSESLGFWRNSICLGWSSKPS